ncbi:DUF3558 domain-containing protein [Amycolatopsis sp. A1MSW2902]|uniref:DUF3558 family protein n=1 Tax=Amycolatopsis sp. A1MSW2902 TaxID=687413 RepID=UPI0009DC3380
MIASRVPKTLLLLGAATVMLTACDKTVDGTAGTSQAPPPTAAPPASSENPFAARNQCALLDQILAGRGFPKATPSVADSQRSCVSKKPGDGPDAGVIGLTLQAGQRYTDNVADPSKAHAGNVNGRPLIEERQPIGSSGSCVIKLAVATNSRALIDVTNGSDTDVACAAARDLAVKLDPLLPKG